MGTLGVQLGGVLPWLARWARHAGTTDFLSCLGCSIVSPVQNIIFLIAHLFTLLVTVAQQTGQAVVLGSLSNVSVYPL